MTAPIRKKLIEVSIPLEAINKASAREKDIKVGVTGQVGLVGSSGLEIRDEVLGISHEALDHAPTLFFGGSDERSDHREVIGALD